MTDARVEAATLALLHSNNYEMPGFSTEDLQKALVSEHSGHGEILFTCKRCLCHMAQRQAKAMLEAADAAAWRPISEAKKDGSPILAKLRNNIYPPVTDESSLRARADYRWNGLTIVLRHPGLANDGFDMGWNVAAPVGRGGFPDDWIEGWQPLPAPPTKEATP